MSNVTFGNMTSRNISDKTNTNSYYFIKSVHIETVS